MTSSPLDPAAPEPVAVISMSGRFPGADTVEQFWANVSSGTESITRFPDPAPEPREQFVGAEGVLGDVAGFDADFFGYSPREAEVMDPQHRMCLEEAWTLFDTAGYDPAALDDPVGVFVSTALSSYLVRNLLPNDRLVRDLGGFPLLMHNDKDFAATTISYKLGLTGPSLSVGSACSSSLVAVHLAARSLQSYECDMAVAGGVSVQVPQAQGYVRTEGSYYSADGRCAAFDRSSSGTVGASGVGLVLLKRLPDALRDRDRVHAVLLGSAVNNDGGNKAGYTAPSVRGQRDAIVEAHAVAGVSAGSIGYVEAHGTGTSIGDPIEVEALTDAFRATTDRTGFCALGSVKTNVGHLDAAAGVTGLIKAVCAVRDGVLPASLHYEEPNPAIDFADSPFHVSATTTPWRAGNTPRRAGVSSFGVGGTNVHVVLEQPPAVRPEAGERRQVQPLLLSARSAQALDQAGTRLAERLLRDPGVDLADVSATLAGRRAHRHRRVVVAASCADAAVALRAPVAPAQAAGDGRAAFLFSGQGSGYRSMAIGLAAGEPAFRRHLDECARLLAEHAVDLWALLDAPTGTPEDQTAGFAVSYSLARTLVEWGVEPVGMVGHSLGEYVAATLAGVFSLPTALRLVVARSQAQCALPEGRMLAVPLGADELRPVLDDGLALAAINAPDRCVVSGSVHAVEAFATRLTDLGLRTTVLPVRGAGHSEAVDQVLGLFRPALAEAEFHAPRTPFLSTVTGDWADPADVAGPDYWLAQMRRPVLFDAAVQRLAELAPAALVELGPGTGLGRLAARGLGPRTAFAGSCLPSAERDPRPEQETEHLVRATGELWASGCRVDWTEFHRPQRPLRTPVPGYPFQRARHWVEAPGETTTAPQPPAGNRPERRADPGEWTHLPGWRHAAPAPAARRRDGETCLLLSEGPLGREVASRLEDLGVHAVFAPVDPDGRADQHRYRELLADLTARDRTPRLIVHLRPFEAAGADRPLDLDAVREGQITGLHSLLHLAQAIGAGPGSEPVRLVAVTRGAQAVLGDLAHPEHATVASAVKVIPRELPRVSATAIDVDAGSAGLADRIVAELLDPASPTEVAYRGPQRFERDYHPLPLGPAARAPEPGGVYLICGGLGGIGLSVAEHLAPTARALVLTRRTPFPGSGADEGSAVLADRLAALTAGGAEVLVRQADVADETRMREVLAEAESRFGPVTGVVHAAGAPDTAGLIQRRSRHDTDDAMASKVLGPVVLDTILGDRPLAFFVLCSSIGSVLHKLKFGEVGYVAGNDFLDAFAAHRASRRPGLTVSIAWTDWRDEAGMWGTVHPKLVERYESAFAAPDHLAPGDDLLGAISRSEGTELFARILAGNRSPRVLVCALDLGALLARHEAFSTEDHRAAVAGLRIARSRRDRSALSSAYREPGTATERGVADCWATLLGDDPIGADDNFFELGGDSLVALRLLAVVRERYGVELSMAQLFEGPTISDLAAAVERGSARGAGGERPDDEEVLL
ncbi:type I polyketide synthase [Actinosynnema mirum]|uniref:KR domain protein n=1 Tax=Actinosynnema mirum (strain ATCC 29888 / DSM 43827 / JCM 3225 / NBRC 14064 / NCIMB 13271 / NRRL B-12336 / IMRU 3971 / 101) TaxID=446462 RepID=C6WBZ9_ACTMD|nr:type I polyketide synthase [Actinosynnema mirum]ACU37566.1 KR domain protein [Actinosynnema mirum DSM 43827]